MPPRPPRNSALPSSTIQEVAKQRAAFQRFLETLTPGSPPPGAELKPVVASDLPPSSQAILGLRCQQGDCLEEQPLCPPDPRITCQLVPADPTIKTWVRDWVKLPWRIANAQKGDLIMSPGGSGGLIGTLLSQLMPPQHYTHMGIMTRDQTEVRQATACGDWLEDNPNGSIILSGPQPSDGFKPDVVRYGWPGTITQSIDVAYQASVDPNFAPAAVKAPNEKFYVIKELGFDTIRINVEADADKRPKWQDIDCLVVSSCPESDKARFLLERIADETKAVRGHYRFFAYTNASICLNPQYFGPPQFETLQPDSNNPCAPPVPVAHTIPVVCSTFIWAAVQRLNARGVKPEIHLQNSDEQNPNACENSLPRNPEWDKPQPGTDGLYFYDEQQRLKAAERLHLFLTEKVKGKIAEKVPGILTVLGGASLTASLALAALSAPAAIVLAVLGISAVEAERLVNWLSDMPEDVANQIVNAFAFDWCETEAKDSDKWRSPGTGVTVSPDNIVRSWGSTLVISDERAIGLYGRNRKAIVRPPRWEIKPISAWAVSAGPSAMTGVVKLKGNPVNGAVVKVCCRKTVSRKQSLIAREEAANGVYKLAPPAGNYLASAAYEEPSTGLLWSEEKPVTLALQTLQSVDFDLQPPPASFREVVAEGAMDIVSRVSIGEDWWGHPQFRMRPMRVGPYGRPNSPEADLGMSAPSSISEQLSDYGSVRVNVTSFWQPDASVKVNWFAAIFDGDEQRVSAFQNDVTIAADSERSWNISLKTAGPDPDRAWIHLTITNKLQP